jgi:HK97 family phage prohead protease
MNRAYSLLTIKAMDDDQRIITGIATTPTPDRVGDIVEPKGAEFKLPIPFLWQHNSSQPLGHVTKAKVTDAGIEITAQLVKIDEPGKLKDRLDEAWQSIKAGLVRGLSIGFKELEYSRLDDGSYGYRFLRWLWLELSAVTIAANGDCTIQTVKSIDASLRAASGREQRAVVRLTPPASGKSNTSTKPQEGKTVKISEKIARFEEKRAANTARIAAIHEETDESLNDQQLDEIKTLEAEIATIDRDLPSLKRVEADLAKNAKPAPRTVDIGHNGGPPLAPTPGVSVKAPEKLEPGIQFTRLVKVKMAGRLAGEPPLVMAQRMYGRDSETAAIITKANEVVAGTTLSGNWAYDLVSQEGAALATFLEYLRPQTILGKFGTGGIPSLTRIDFYTPYVIETGAGAAYWVGEGKPKPLTAFDYDRSTLTPLKIANIAVLTEENIRYSTPNSDMIVRNALVKAIVAGIDVAFVDPSNNGSANVKPASVTYGADTWASVATTDADAIRTEIRGVFQTFINANNPPMSGVWIMSATNALALGMMTNTLGQPEFPGLGMTGGTLQGLPVIVSQHIGDVVALVNASDIFLGDEGGVAVDMSREASIEMRSTGLGMDATAGTATAASVSMFQTNSVALRAERTISWKRARNSAVAYLSSVTWGGDVPDLS